MVCDAAGTVRGIVLAGIHQWDSAALDALLPRPLLPVAQAPLICYPLWWLRDGGISAVTVCANSASRLVRQFLGDGGRLGLELDYYEDWTPRGPAGCVRDAGLCAAADVYVVTDGTIIPQTDLAELLAAHQRAAATITVAVHPVFDGNAAEGVLRPAGIYVFDRAALEHVPPTGYQDIKEVLIPRLHQRGARVAVHPISGSCPRVAGFDSYLAISAWMLEQLAAQPAPPREYTRRGEALIHDGATVAGSALLMGPVLAGPGAHVGEHTTVVGPTVLGAASEVAERAVVCRSVLWDGCVIGRDSMLDQCVIAQDVFVEPRARIYSRYVGAPQRSRPRAARGAAPHALQPDGSAVVLKPGGHRSLATAGGRVTSAAGGLNPVGTK